MSRIQVPATDVRICEEHPSEDAELNRITPSNAELRKLARRFPAPQEWPEEELFE
jgi:hypothetical protein